MKKLMLVIFLSLMAQMLFAVENALHFDGTNDYVNISSAITAPTTTQAVTIETWVFPTTDSDTRLIASKYKGGDKYLCNFLLTRNTSQKIFIAGNGTNVLTSNGSVPLNAWTHVAVVFQSGTDNTKIYINGNLDISGTLTYNTSNSSTALQIGQFTNISSYPVYQEWTGVIDEFRLWNTVRSGTEIAVNMNSSLTGTETGLVAYYGFNHGTAYGVNTGITTLADLTGHGWNGTLYNFALSGTTSNWVQGVMNSGIPVPPVATFATLVGSTGFRAEWNAAVMADGYRLDVASDSLFTDYIPGYQDLEVYNSITQDVTGLVADTYYYYRVRSYNSEGTSESSNVIAVQTASAGNDDYANVIDEEKFYDWNGSDWEIQSTNDYIHDGNRDIIELKKYGSTGTLLRTYSRLSYTDYYTLRYYRYYNDGHTITETDVGLMYLNDNRYKGLYSSSLYGGPGGYSYYYQYYLNTYSGDRIVQTYDSLYQEDTENPPTCYTVNVRDIDYDSFGRKTYEFEKERYAYLGGKELVLRDVSRTNWTYDGYTATGIMEVCTDSLWGDSVKTVQAMNSDYKPFSEEIFVFQSGLWVQDKKFVYSYDLSGNLILKITYKYNAAGGIYEFDEKYTATYYTDYLVPPLAGAGTLSEPYLVSTKLDVSYITEHYQIWDKYFIQTADIDLSGTKDGLSPIGDATTRFTGHYDGQGYKINGLYINTLGVDRVGFFGNALNAEIKNVNLLNVNILGNNSVGAVVGYAENADVINCSSTGFVTGTDNAGGIAGYLYNGSSITQSGSSCTVSGVNYLGGLAGYNTTNSIISDSYATGSVTGTDYIGGLAGCNTNTSTITNTYTCGAVNGGKYIGGLLGLNSTSSVLHNSYAASVVSGTEYYIGGALGYNDTATSGVVQNILFDYEVSGSWSNQGCIPRTTAQMKTLSTYTSRTWDFVGETANGTNDYWNLNGTDNNGYPFLSWQVFGLTAPQNITIAYTTTEPQLSWSAASGASSYNIYSTANPYAEFPSGWTLAASGVTGTNWVDMAVTGAKKFYVVVAVSGKEGEVTSKEKVRSLKIKTIKN
jgi:hypothetical protein